ncbi:MAG TPA: hypothetical protein VGO03_07875 [Acidimicrobiia bacterium]|jgi:hypothetical protein
MASRTARQLTRSLGRGVDLFADGIDYTSVESWRTTNLPPNVVQRRMLANKHWVALGPAGPPGTTRFSVDAIFDGSPFTASFDVLAGLRAAHFAIRRVGATAVRGAATTEYRATGSAQEHDFNVTRLAPAVIEVWVDRTGRTRRIHAVVHYPASSDDPPSIDEFTTEFYDVGAPLHIATPNADDIVNGRALSRAFMCQPLPTKPPKATPDCR